MATEIDTKKPIGINDWHRRIFDDEVVFFSVAQTMRAGTERMVSQYPCIDGFFMTDAPPEFDSCTRILAGPFPTLEIAIASIAILA